MDSRDTQSYQEVHTIDEGIRSSLKRFLGRKKKEAEAPKPMSRGEVLRQRYNVGPEKSDTSAKRQILNRSRARAERDEEKYGGSIYTKKVADKSREAHNRYLKAGYSKYGATHTAGSAPEQGRGNKARKRAAALNKEEFDFILYHLVNEGYTNNLKSAEVIASNMSEEWVESIVEELTGERRTRALEKGGYLANRVASGKEGQPVERRNRSGDVTMRTTTKGPTKRGGIGFKGKSKSDWYGGDDTHGSGNKSRRRSGLEVKDTSDDL
jgi:hypothetical protein